jgi:hypothetical protein
MDRFKITEEEVKVLKKQMKRKIDEKVKIVKYCKYGYPQIIRNYPLKKDKPFPTLHWLSCPFLNSEISKLESIQEISRIQKIIDEDENLRTDYFKAHQEEIKIRLEILDDKINKLSSPIKLKLRETGIGGIKNFSNIKCLHLHVASYLGGIKNPVGKIVVESLENLECANCICCDL